MSAGLRRGRLAAVDDAPVAGERIERVLEVDGVVIEQILSSDAVEPVTYDQEHDEWVVVTAGSATIELEGDDEGEPLSLEAGDWVFLPARMRHRVTRTAAGTTWLAVHLPDRPG
jgi:cupin 2 domain-containing protein